MTTNVDEDARTTEESQLGQTQVDINVPVTLNATSTSAVPDADEVSSPRRVDNMSVANADGGPPVEGEEMSRAGPSYRGAVAEAKERRPQAGPLPKKLGEFGFQERYQQQLADANDEEVHNGHTQAVLPERHPADRDSPAPVTTPEPSEPQSRTGVAESTSTNSTNPTRKGFASKSIPALGGVHLATLLLLILQIFLICGTIAGWVVAAMHLGPLNTSANSANGSTSASPFGGTTYQIFAHVLFTIALIMQLVFLERRIFRVRAERYCYANPGLPLFSRRREGGLNIALAPWNRPPLPTYAAVLAQSGVGTGDVEDSAIAIPPPPAYGITRGSTLLMSGLISDTLRAQRRELARSGSRAGSVRSSVFSLRSMTSRPVSYASHDEEWEARRDAMRAARLEETLARLEEPRARARDGELRR